MRETENTVAALCAALVLLAASAARAEEPPPEASYPLDGVVALSGCSGAVFRFDGQSDDDRALVLTNGHCIGFMGQYEVLVAEPTEREVTPYDSADTQTDTYLAREIVYATMYRTDMAILRLDATYRELADASVDALVLSTERPTAGEEIAIVSGLWEYVARCQLDGFVHQMQEGQWTWFDSLRFTQECVTFGGTSGSPVISVASGEIVGVNNTGYEGGEPCSVNNPCEIDENGTVTTIADGSYGQQTYQLYACIDDAFELDLDRPGCELPRPSGVLRLGDIALRSDQECDADGNFDPGETAVVEVSLFNEGPVDLAATTLMVWSPTDGVEVDGASIQVGAIPAFETVTVEVPVTLALEARDATTVSFEIAATDPGSVEPEVAGTSLHRVNFDDVPNSSTVDDVESNAVPWTVTTESELDGAGWARVAGDRANTVWRAVDIDGAGDQRLESPALEVGDGELTVRFTHRYRFETSRDTFWDGGVIELSTDGGESWVDATEFADDFGYAGAITDQSGNPLAARDAFVGESPGWPETAEVALDFGDRLAGREVRLRFRVGTDAAAGDFGWEIDDIAVDGIDNLPFSSIREGAASCDPPDGEDPDDPDPPQSDGGCSAGGATGSAWLPALWLAVLIGGRRRRRATAR